MDLDEAITVTKLTTPDGKYHLMIGWQSNSFEMYLFAKDKLWKGRFSSNRLAGFSRNLHMTEDAYLASVKNCLSQQRDDYRYELKSGFFYWKRKLKDSVAIEGFLPMELDTGPINTQPDILEVLLALNRHLKDKVNNLNGMFKAIKIDYQKCLKDTEEFLKLKVDMEKALCDKFLNLINVKKIKVDALTQNESLKYDIKEKRIDHQNTNPLKNLLN